MSPRTAAARIHAFCSESTKATWNENPIVLIAPWGLACDHGNLFVHVGTDILWLGILPDSVITCGSYTWILHRK